MTRGAKRRAAMLATAMLGVAVGILLWDRLSPGQKPVIVQIAIPDLSDAARRGKAVFDADCAQCHGANAAGSGEGPPLVHPIYKPDHHADAAFYLAIRRGVSQHHWRFGAMPPQPQINDDEIAAIVLYVRELQKANGIDYRKDAK